jgi:hypothetical protein
MDVESLAKQLILQNMTPEQQSAVLESVRATLQEARGNHKRRVSENVGAVVDALKKIEADIRAKYDDLGQKITTRVNSIRDGRDGINGSDGRDGLDGRPGRDGAQGPAGPAGRDGVNGVDGVDGVSVTDAAIDFDGSLVISLSNGREINVGEVVAPDLAERIKVITNGGGTSQEVLDTLASLQAQIDALNVLTYEGTWDASTNTPTLASGVGEPGDYYIVSVAGSTDLDGITDWQPGDWVIFNGTVWQKIDQSWATAGVNNNITSMTGITGGISSPDFIQFDTTATVTDATGRLYYNDEDMYQTLAFQMNGNVIQHVGEEMFYRVRLSAAATKGQVLMFTGTLGASGGLTAAPATGLTFDQSNYLLGIAGESGSTNDWITVYEFGEVTGVNTSAFTQGQILYYDPTVAGGLTATKPNTPNAIAVIAAVVHVGTSNGVLFVRPTFGSALGGTDGNVRFGTLASGNTIIYDAVDGVWKNANLTDGTGISITEGAGSITITNSAPDQTVALTGAGTTSISGTYPNFTVTSNDQYVGTVTSVGGTGTVNGISLSGTVTSSGSLTLGGALTGVDLTTQVTGTLPIANGGTGQTSQTAAFDALSPTTTKGDLIVSNGSDNVRLPVGTNNYVLVADSAEATGVKWSAGGSGMTDPGANGIVVRTAVNTTTARTITAGTGISVTDGDGVSGNPTIANSGVTSIAGTTNEVEVSASTGSVTVGLPSAINVNLNGTVGATTPAAGTFTSLSDSGNLTFTGTGNRITGDFSNATQASRVLFQTSTANTTTAIGAIPSGTGTISNVNLFSLSDPTNASFAQLRVENTQDVRLSSGITGTGTYLPMTFYTGGSERMRIDSSGNVEIGTQALGTSTDTRKVTIGSNGYAVLAIIGDYSNTSGEPGGAAVIFDVDGISAGPNAVVSYVNTAGTRGDSSATYTGTTSNSMLIGTTNATPVYFGTNAVVQAAVTDTGDLQFNSGYGSVATAYGCRAWVNFDGTSNTANLTGTYARTSPSTTVTVTITAHGLTTGDRVFLDFTTGTGVDGEYVATVTGLNTFTVTTVASTTTSGNVTLRRNTIRASGNVSSVSDMAVGLYAINFAAAMPDANYAVASMSAMSIGATDVGAISIDNFAEAMTAQAVQIFIEDVDAGGLDSRIVMVTIHR